MGKAIKKPVEIEFHVWDGDNIYEVVEFMGGSSRFLLSLGQPVEGEHYLIACNLRGETVLNIKTLEGKLNASIGDYIIKGVKGEFYPIKADIFEMTYDVVGDSNG